MTDTPASNAIDASSELLTGVFSTVVRSWIGAGTTRRKTEQQVAFYVQEQPDGTYTRQALNEKFIPSGPLETLEREELLRNYTPEAKLFTEKLLPAVRLMTKAIAKGERLRERGKPYNAELEFRNALVLDENNVRANFGLGMTLMDQGNEDESGQIFERLMDQDETFKPDNKHLFNEYGMRLRKNGMFDKALRYYDKAYILSDRDEHLLYNIARTHYERGAHDDALLFADKALAINPGLKAASDLKAIIQNQQ